ncbi:MAG: glycosyltransferase family 61 protein [Sphingobacteriales bacterium]|nr:MAG: glycosyltransferase family 61 protein [Sphingobacteriales bacterium]
MAFSIVYLEDYSVADQVKLFYNAREIIAIHGAGLTNLIFAQPGTTVIELFPVSYVNQCYWTIASKNKLQYSYLLGEGVDVTTEKNHLIDSDFYISVEKLLALRQACCN